MISFDKRNWITTLDYTPEEIRGLIDYAGNPQEVWELVQYAAAESSPQRLLVFPTHRELVEMAQKSGWSVEPLGSSKGFGAEMVLVLDEEVVTPPILEDLFCWGLEQA